MADPTPAAPASATIVAADPAAIAPAPTPAAATDPPKTLLTADSVDPAKPDSAKPAESAKPDVKTAPEKYDFAALKMPKGIELNADLIGAVEPVFKKLGLSQEAASELVQAHSDALGKVALAQEQKAEADFKTFMADRAKQNVDAVRKEWGHEFDANLALAQKGLARLFPDGESKAKLDETGLGNDPAFLKAFLAVGKMISEDKPPTAGVTNGAQRSPASVLYGSGSTATN